MTLTPDPTAPSRRRVRTAVLVLVVVTLAIYGRCTTFEFVNWDDPELILNNPILNPVSWAHVKEAWAGPVKNLYSPLAYTAWSVIALASQLPTPDINGSRLNPMVFHAFNVFLHMGCVLMVFAILLQVLRRWQTAPGDQLDRSMVWAAGVGAAVFALHPLQVEAVCWISGMNNLLAGLFVLIAVWAHVRATSPGERMWRWQVVSVVAVALGLCSKPTAIVAPLVLLVLDLLILRRAFVKAIVSIVPIVLVTIPFVFIGRSAQTAEQIVAPTLSQRGVIMVDTIGAYFSKIAWPHPLIFDYGRVPKLVIEQGPAVASVIAILIAGALIVFGLAAKRPAIAGCILIFVVTILPVSGITPFTFQYYSTVADRYAYLGMLGVAILTAMVVLQLKGRAPQIVGYALGSVLAILCFVQCGHWTDTYTLTGHALAYNPRSFTSYDMLGYVSRQHGDPVKAEAYFRKSLEIWPADPFCNFNLGSLLFVLDRPAESIEYLRAAVRLGYRNSAVMYPLGASYLKVGRIDEAITALKSAVQLEPDQPYVHATLGYALAANGNLDEAEQHLRWAIQLEPANPLANMGLKKVLAAKQAGPTPK